MTGDAPKLWYSARELANVNGLPATVSGVIRLAKREGWATRKRQGRGGGIEYSFESLPTQARRALVAKMAPAGSAVRVAQPAGKTAEQKLLALQKLSGWKRDKTNLAMEIWEALEVHHRRARCSWPQTVEDYNSGAITVSEQARASRPTLSWPTFERWRSKVNRDGLAGLCPKYGNRAGAGVIDTAPWLDARGEQRFDPKTGECLTLKHWIIGLLLKEPQIKASHVHARIDAEWPGVSISETRLADWIRRWKTDNASDWLRLTNPDAWKNRYAPAFGDAFENIIELNQLWEMDSSPSDWMLTDGRHAVIQCKDLFSRRTRFLVAKTSNGHAIAALFRRCVMRWGLPRVTRTDQGLDYTGCYFRQVLRDLGVEHDECDAYESQQKGTVERGFGVAFHSILESLPGFVGHNVAERKAIEARKSFEERRSGEKAIEVAMSGAELQQWLDDWCDYVYERDPQTGLGDRSPFEVAASWRGGIRTIENERALDLLLMPIAGIRTVQKDKGIQWGNNEYVDRHGELATRIGDKVTCRHDPADAGALYVYSLDGEFICLAECPELRGISRAEVAAAAHAKVAAFKAEQDQELRGYKRQIKRSTAEVVIEHRREQAGVVSMLPHQATPVTTPALEQAARAVTSAPRSPKPAPQLDARAQEILQGLRNGTYQPNRTTPGARAPTAEEDQARWFARLERIEAAIAAGEPVPDTDLAWRQRFKQQPIYTARQRLRGDRSAAQG